MHKEIKPENKVNIVKPFIGNHGECEKCNNKCENCPLKDKCDFDWIYHLASAESELLGYWHTGDMKLSMVEAHGHGKVLITEDKKGVVHFSSTVHGDGHTSIYHICVDPSARGKQYSIQLIDAVTKITHLPIKSICIAGSESDKFWSHIAKKVGIKYSKVGTPLNVYIYGENTIDEDKEELW